MQQTTAPEEYKNHVAPGKDWKEIVAWVGDLPPLPQVAAQAIALIEDPDSTAGKLSDLLGKDPALAARVLKIANSAMFSCQREITTISQAIMVIGFKALKGIIVAATLRQLNRKFGPVEKMIWENSAATAVICRLLTQKLKKPYVDEAFLLGLLHDLGKLVMMRQIPTEYAKVIEEGKKGVVYTEGEQKFLGFSHPLIGALVAKKWNFSADTCQVILHHHDPYTNPIKTELEEKTAIVQLGDLIAHKLGFGHTTGYVDLMPATLACMKRLGLEESGAEQLFEDANKAFGEQGGVLM